MFDPIIREKAKRLYVDEGLSSDSITKMLPVKVERHAINQWRRREKWDEQRQKKAEQTISLRERLERLLENAIENAETNLNPQTIFAIGKLVTALRTSTLIDFTDEKLAKEADHLKKLTKEKLAELEKELGVL
jgi:hypothetical protein